MANAIFLADIRGPLGPVGPAGPGFYLGPAGEVWPIKNLKTMPEGWVTVGDSVNATYLGLPEAQSGIVRRIIHNDTTSQLKYETFHLDGSHTWTQQQNGGVWSSWRRTDAKAPPRTLPLEANMNTYYGDDFSGQWRVTSAVNAATMFNLPLTSSGAKTTTVIDVLTPYGFQMGYVYEAGSSTPNVQVRSRTTFDNTIVDAWTPWVSIVGGGSQLANVAQDNKAHLDSYTQARGGSIGTGGLAAVALRFDHNLVNFRDIILPLLKARNLCWSQAVNTAQNQIDFAANGGIWGTTLQGYVLNDGGELLAHSHTHSDSTSTAAIIANVEDSIPVFASAMPELVVEGFAPPGAGGTNWNGFLDTSSKAHFTSKYTGASAVLKNFAFCTGYIQGPLRQLSGTVTNGQTHITLDAVTSAASTISTMQQAQEMGAGVQLMMHPNMLTLPDKITTAVLTEILDWIAAERDAGRLLVLTTSGLLVADARHAYRANILRGFGTAVWSSLTGWTVAGGVATGSTSAGVMSGAVSLSSLAHVKGRPRELAVEARSATGASLRVGVTGSTTLSVSKTFTVPGGNTWNTYRVPFSLPVSATSLTVSLGRLSGGTMEMRAPAIQAV